MRAATMSEMSQSTVDGLSNQVAYSATLSADKLLAEYSCVSTELGNRLWTGLSVLQHWQDAALSRDNFVHH